MLRPPHEDGRASDEDDGHHLNVSDALFHAADELQGCLLRLLHNDLLFFRLLNNFAFLLLGLGWLRWFRNW